MKQILLVVILSIFSFAAAQAQKVGDKIQIEHSGSWYDGKILKVEGDKYYVTYDGWSDSWDEWVGIDRIKNYSTDEKKNLTKYKVGDKVEVEYGMIPEPGTIIEVGENKYHVKFDNSLYGSKWVTEKQIKKL